MRLKLTDFDSFGFYFKFANATSLCLLHKDLGDFVHQEYGACILWIGGALGDGGGFFTTSTELLRHFGG